MGTIFANVSCSSVKPVRAGPQRDDRRLISKTATLAH